MGAQNSKITEIPNKENKKLLHEIASKYILSQNSKDLIKLANPEKCKKLVIMTSNAINKYFTPKYISYMDSKLKGMREEKLLFFNKDESVLNRFDAKGSSKDKKCIGIAKFYVKIAHLFSAISLTINPIYKWKSPTSGDEKTASLLNIEKHPDYPDLIDNQEVSVVLSDNFCTKRHSKLIKIQKDLKKNNSKFIDLSPMCKTREKEINQTGIKTLAEETGFSSLEKLYFDKYNYEKGVFYKDKDSPANKKYLEHLKLLYNTFKKSTDIPYEEWNKENNKRFVDVLIEYQHTSEKCIGEKKVFRNQYALKDSDLLFSNYITFVKEMIDRSDSARKQIVALLYKVFKLSVTGDHTEIVIDPGLNSKKLDEIVKEAREKIFNLYVQCEKDYKEALARFDAIIKDGEVINTLKKLQTLDEEEDKLNTSSELKSTDLVKKTLTFGEDTNDLDDIDSIDSKIKEYESLIQDLKEQKEEKMSKQQPYKDIKPYSSPSSIFNSEKPLSSESPLSPDSPTIEPISPLESPIESPTPLESKSDVDPKPAVDPKSDVDLKQPIGSMGPIGSMAPVGSTAPLGSMAPVGSMPPIKSDKPVEPIKSAFTSPPPVNRGSIDLQKDKIKVLN